MKTNNNSAFKISTLYNKWIGEITSIRSPHTIRSFMTSISSFLIFLEDEKKIETSTFCGEKELNRDTVVQWLDWLSDVKKDSPQTCNIRLANLRSFVKYLAANAPEYRTVYMELQTINQRRQIKHKVEGMSKKAIKTILCIPDTSKNIGLRDAVMLSLLYTTAIRIEELTSIKLCDLNLDVEFPYVVIKGKGNKIRTLTLPQKMIQLLRRYLAIYHGVTSELDNYLFFSKIKGRMYPITEVGVSKRIKLYGNKAREICIEVPENLHAHQFRHARATHWLDDGLNIAQISRLLGHSSIATTMVYLDITDEMKSTAITSRMNEEIKSIKPKWTNREIKSLLTLFGLNKQTH